MGKLKKLEAMDADNSVSEKRLEPTILRERKTVREPRQLFVPGDGWLGGAGRFLARI